jgi:hypothetical protein
MEENRLREALSESEHEAGSAEGRAQKPEGASPPEPDRSLDMRHRRGSLGPPPAAAPLGEAASSAALQSHLAHLLDASRETAPSPDPGAATAEPGIGPHEDLERQPDGVPHLVIGLTALCSVLFAAVLIRLLLSGPTLGSIAAAALAVIAVPVIVSMLGAKAERDRDHDHPSR